MNIKAMSVGFFIIIWIEKKCGAFTLKACYTYSKDVVYILSKMFPYQIFISDSFA